MSTEYLGGFSRNLMGHDSFGCIYDFPGQVDTPYLHDLTFDVYLMQMALLPLFHLRRYPKERSRLYRVAFQK